MQTLIPESASAKARPTGRTGRWAGFGLTARALLLLVAGFAWAVPAFWFPRMIWFVLGWDVLVLVLAGVDAWMLPAPRQIEVTRTFLESPEIGEAVRIELALTQESDVVLDVTIVDDLHPSLVATPLEQRVQAFPRDAVMAVQTVFPRERGDFAMGRVYLRYRGVMKLVERWAAAEPVVVGPQGSLPAHVRESGHGAPHGVHVSTQESAAANGGRAQRVRVYPASEQSGEDAEFYLMRARQIEQQKRRLRLRGIGREFESLRDYQKGDELRNVSWTATARRGYLITRQFTVERSQQVWIVLDAGRLSRTAFELKRGGKQFVAETDVEQNAAHLLTVTQLDQAATAAVMLAQVVQSSGDKFALMTYGRAVQQALPPGAGPLHMRMLIDLLSQSKSEAAEADHLYAVARLKNMQRRRGLIVWITEMSDSVGRPELVAAAAELVRRHLVVLVLLKHPELDALAAKKPSTQEEMYESAAAQEMLERRRETMAQLRRQGVLIVETGAGEVGVNAISKYLEVKAEGLL